MPNEDASKNREGDGSLALGGHRLVIRHNSQPIFSGSNKIDDGEDARLGWTVRGGGGGVIFQGGELNGVWRGGRHRRRQQ